MNWIKELIDTRRQKKAVTQERKQQEQLLGMFASFEQAERKRLVFLDILNKRVLLSDILTGPFAMNDQAWEQFFENLSYWFRFRMQHEHWNKVRIAAENAALKEAKKEHGNLSKEEVKIIRAKAAMDLEYDESKNPTFDGYEFCICEGILRSDVKAEAVGVWKDGHIDLRAIGDITTRLKKEKIQG